MQKTVDVIIPTYKPGQEFMQLIEALEVQTYPITKIIIMNTEEAFFDEKVTQFANVEVHHIKKQEFDHGRTRNLGVSFSDSDIFVCMTQDAIPANAYLIENLVKGLMQEDAIAASYARQLPREDCREIERFSRGFNYPEVSRIKGKEDIPVLGIKTFFCSNVCAAYKRSIFDALGGFVNKTIFNEDMIYAGTAVQNGMKIAYCADAEVIHSHNYSNFQQLHRNFDLGVSQAEHPEIFSVVSSESEGVSMVKQVTSHLWKVKKGYWIPYFYLNCAFKYLGYLLGTHYQKLSYGIIIRCTDNKAYWEKFE